jgi:aminoglycoside 3-N-acetyltransferase
MSNLQSVMATSPYLEVIIRNLYWRVTPIVKWYNKKKKIKRVVPTKITSRKFIECLSSQGIGNGSRLILHSSFSALNAEDEKPDQVIDQLLKLLGPEGTLAMPAIPVFKDSPGIAETMKADVSNLVLTYDPLTTPAGTGALPNAMIQYPGAVRSLHPFNSMVAIGPLARPMMENNLSGEKPLPCGRNSSWYFCCQHNFEIVAAGADLAHSLTMIHVAEDMWDDTWVVPNWYRDRSFLINTGYEYKKITVRERCPRWAMHYAERTLSKDLIQSGVAKRSEIDGVNVEIVNSRSLINYLNSRNHNGYPYYLVPRDRTRTRNHETI